MERGANGINNSIEILPHPFLNHNEIGKATGRLLKMRQKRQ